MAWNPGVGRDSKGYQKRHPSHGGGGGGNNNNNNPNPHIGPTAAEIAAAKAKKAAEKKALEDAKYKTWITDTKEKKKKKTDWVDKTLKTADTVDKLYKFGTTLNPLNLYKTNPYILGGSLLKSLYDKNKKSKEKEKVSSLDNTEYDFSEIEEQVAFKPGSIKDRKLKQLHNQKKEGLMWNEQNEKTYQQLLEEDKESETPTVLSADGGRVGFQSGGWADGLEGEAKGIYDSMTAYGASDAEIQAKLQAQNLWSPDGTTTDTEQVTGIINQDIGGDGGGIGELDLTFTEGAVPRGPTTDFNINPAAQLTGKGRLDPMGSDVDYFNTLSGPERFNFGFQMSDVPGQPGYQAPSKYFQEPSLIDKGIGSIKDFFSGLGTPKVRGTLGERLSNKPRIPLPGAMASWSMSPFNEKSRNYNENFVDQLNFLESSGAPGGYIGRDEKSGLLKYGPDSVLAGKNVISMFGSNNYEEALEKKKAWFEKRINANKKYNKDKYQQTLDEITAWNNSPDNPKNKDKPAGPAHTILGPDNPLIGKIDHTGAGSGHGSITRAPGSKGPKGTPTHRTRDDLMASGGRVGLGSMFVRKR